MTHALGSCVAVCLWDPVTHVAGMLHFLLPESKLNAERAARQPARSPTPASRCCFRRRTRPGAVKSRLRVQLLGGAAITGGPNGLDVGRRNALIAKKILWQNGVLVKGEVAWRNRYANRSGSQPPPAGSWSRADVKSWKSSRETR